MAKGTFGERLKRERELRDVTVNEIASATRIASKFLEALENEQWDKLPGGVFGRGFVRSIARYLGLSEENLLSEYDLARGESSLPAEQKPEERIPSPPKWLPAAALAVLIALVVGLVLGGRYAWQRYLAHRAAKKASAMVSLPVTPAMQNLLLNGTRDSSAIAREKTPAPNLRRAPCPATQGRVVSDGGSDDAAEVPAGWNLRFSAKEQSAEVLLQLNFRTATSNAQAGSSGTISLSLRQATGGTTQR
jgi:cytoskeleton protein RodZ